VVPFLAKAKRALFLGDNQDISAFPVMSALPEEWDLKYHQLDDEELMEQLQYKGMLAGTGNAFSVALANSAYQKFSDHGMFLADLSLSTNATLPKLHALNEPGESKSAGNALINEQEATKIAAWLKRDLSNELSQTAIVTPFIAQKELMLAKLKAQNIDCEVLTFCEVTEKQWSNIDFSPVYTQKDQRPFIFDQGEQLLYSITVRALHHLWVVGDLSIFDPKMHSPSGNLAKLLFEKEPEQALAH
jgi:hypothetical protein